MRVCVCVCAYKCARLCVCLGICACVYACESVRVSLCACAHKFACLCMRTHTNSQTVQKHLNTSACEQACKAEWGTLCVGTACVCLCVCVGVRMCACGVRGSCCVRICDLRGLVYACACVCVRVCFLYLCACVRMCLCVKFTHHSVFRNLKNFIYRFSIWTVSV